MHVIGPIFLAPAITATAVIPGAAAYIFGEGTAAFSTYFPYVGTKITPTLSNLLPDKIGVPTPFGTISVSLPLAQGALDWAANTLSTIANSAIKSYNGGRDYIDSITPKSGIGYYAVQIAAAPVDIGAGQLEIFAGGASGMISAAAHPVRTITDAPKAFIMGAAGLVDRALVANDTPLKTHLANGVKAIGNTSIRQGSTAVGRTMGYVALIAAPAKGLGGLGTVTRIEARAANGIGVAAERGAAIEARGGAYVLKDFEGNVVRSGRSGDLTRRAADHRRDPLLKDYDFDPVYRTDVYAEQRGLEKILHDTYQPPLDKIRPISPTNPKRQIYIDAAQKYLGGN